MPEVGDALSDREMEVLRLVATGASNDQIARQLVISPNTVKVHLRNIFVKLGVASRTEASLYAIRQGWVAVPATSSEEVAVETAGAAPARPARFLRWIFLAGLFVLLLAVVLFLSLSDLPRKWLFPNQSPLPTTGLAAERWNVRAPMPTARSDLALIPYQGLLYAIGGNGLQGVSNAVERYDPASDAWQALAPKTTAVAEAQGAVLSGRIYLPGGRNGLGVPVAVTEVYDIALDRWDSAAPLPRRLSAYALVAYEGKLFLFGGWDGAGYRDEILRYIPEENRWEEVGRLPFPLGYASAVVADNRVLILGGVNAGGPVHQVLEYSPFSAVWVSQPLPVRSQGHVRATALAEYLFLLVESEDGSVPQIWQHNVRTGPKDWQMIAPSPNGMYPHMALAGSGTQLYVVGGRDGATPLAQTQEFQALFNVSVPLPLP